MNIKKKIIYKFVIKSERTSLWIILTEYIIHIIVIAYTRDDDDDVQSQQYDGVYTRQAP